jgi:hypothetical protein
MGKHQCTTSMLSAAGRAREPVTFAPQPATAPTVRLARDLAAHLIAAGTARVAGSGPA